VRVAVLGAGVTGLVAALRLAEAGHAVDVYERWPGLGGMAATFEVDPGVRLERYYHHWFASDRHIVALMDELGLGDQVGWHASSTAIFAQGRVWPFTTPADVLRYAPMPLASRVRMGVAAVLIQRLVRDGSPLERRTARTWIVRTMGRPAWDHVWGPLMRGKYRDEADRVAAVWLWGKLALRRSLRPEELDEERLGYPEGSFEVLFSALSDRIRSLGGRIHLDRPAAALGLADPGDPSGRLALVPGAAGSFRAGRDPRAFAPDGPPEEFDRVVATVPGGVLLDLLTPELAEAVGTAWTDRVRDLRYVAALTLLLEVDADVDLGEHYWVNVVDEDVPFVAVVDHSRLVGTEAYGGRRFVYVANYLPAGHDLMQLDADELLAAYLPGLRRISPGLRPEQVRRSWVFREPDGQPVVGLRHRDALPSMLTDVPGLVLATTAQIYPQDRGTNYAVLLGERAADAVLRGVDAVAAVRDTDVLAMDA
jgi:protoporphyrinogen oxidase